MKSGSESEKDRESNSERLKMRVWMRECELRSERDENNDEFASNFPRFQLSPAIKLLENNFSDA